MGNKHTRARQQARAQYDNIRTMVMAWRGAKDDRSVERAETAIHEDPLCIEVRDGWRTQGFKAEGGPEEYRILLCTGGPAVRMVGDLQGGEPSSAALEFQDWGTPWTRWQTRRGDAEAVMLDYARRFYFGEG